MQKKITDEIVAKAIAYGASLAGVAATSELEAAPSYRADGIDAGMPPQNSALVLALGHPADRLELDWWDGDRGTPGNRRMIEINLQLCDWLKQEYGMDAGDLPYYVGAGGVYLKDAAVLAGLGVIGRNNLLIAPGYGPRIRLRAILIGAELTPSPRLKNFSPCKGCPKPCTKACPREAFGSGSYDRPPCLLQMDADVENQRALEINGTVKQRIRYCRDCELVCPAGT